MMKPYISVTGFTMPSEVGRVQVPKIPGYDIFFGVLCNHLTLSNLGRTSRFPALYDFERTLNQIERTEHCHPVVHYCFGDRDIGTIEDDVRIILKHPIHAIQFNTVSSKALREAVHMVARCAVVPYLIFQLNVAMMNKFKLNVGKLCQLFSVSTPSHDESYVLLDLSGGKGRPLDYETGVAVRDVCWSFKNLNFAVSGGIRPETVDEVITVMGPRVGVDAETNLRMYTGDTLCPEKINDYLANAANAVSRIPKHEG